MNSIPFDRPLTNPTRYTFGQYPATPLIPQVKNQQVANCYMSILHALYSELNTFNSPVSPAKIYLFNQMSMNNYNNQSFSDLVSYTAKLLDMLHPSTLINDQVVMDIVAGKAIPHLGSKNIFENNYLQSSLNQEFQQMASSLYQEFCLTLQAMQNVNHNYNAPPMPYNNPNLGFQHPQQPYQNNGFQNNTLNNNNQYQNSVYQPPPLLSRPVSGTNRFNTSVVQNNVSNKSIFDTQSSQGQKSFSKYDQFHIDNITKPPIQKQPTPIATQPNVNVVTVTPTSNVINITSLVNIDKEPPISWMQNIPLAFDPNTYITNDKGEVVNQNDHFKTPSYAINIPVNDVADSKVRTYGVESKISEINKEIKLIPKFTLEENNASEYLDVSLEDILYRTDADLKSASGSDGKVTLARNIGMVITPLFMKSDHQAFIDDVVRCADLTEVVNILKKAIIQLNNKEAIVVDKTTIAFINKRLTKAFNEMLRNEFSESVQIESFIEDLESAIKYIDSKGEQTSKSLVAKEKQFIENNLYYLPQSSAVQCDENYKFNKSTKALYFGEDVSVTCVDLYSDELRVDLPVTDKACGISSSKTPLFYSLAENCIMHKRSYMLHRFKCYIKTLDGVVYEVNEGALNKEFYLVSIKSK